MESGGRALEMSGRGEEEKKTNGAFPICGGIIIIPNGAAVLKIEKSTYMVLAFGSFLWLLSRLMVEYC